MNRPPVEMADILRIQGDCFREQNRFWLGYQQLSVLRAITRCRTAALGGHLDSCSRCDLQAISYNSCRNRHCPKCQAQARQRWLARREQDLLPVPYFHVVFTLPHALNPLCQRHPRLLYVCSSAPQLRPCLKSQPTPGISEPGSASSASCIPGDRTCACILTSTA